MDTLAITEDQFVKRYLLENGSIITQNINFTLGQMMSIDLDMLPKKPFDFALVLISWLVKVNKKRIENGDEPIMTYDVIKLCPIWKLVPMPIRKLQMASMNRTRPSVATRSTLQPKGFNSNLKGKK